MKSPQSTLSPMSWAWPFSSLQVTLLTTELVQQRPNGSSSVHSPYYTEIFIAGGVRGGVGEPMSRFFSFIHSNKYILSPHHEPDTTVYYIKTSHPTLTSFCGRKPWFAMFANSSGKCFHSHRGQFQVTSVILTNIKFLTIEHSALDPE